MQRAAVTQPVRHRWVTARLRLSGDVGAERDPEGRRTTAVYLFIAQDIDFNLDFTDQTVIQIPFR